MEQHDCDESQTLFEIHAERSQNCHLFCKTLSIQEYVVLQSTAPLQLKRFKVGSKLAIAASAPVLLIQKKQCCKIARFTDAPCICRTEKCFENNLQKKITLILCPTNFPYFLRFSIKFNKGRKGAKTATQTSLMKNRQSLISNLKQSRD
jgi:hypothetical protein